MLILQCNQASLGIGLVRHLRPVGFSIAAQGHRHIMAQGKNRMRGKDRTVDRLGNVVIAQVRQWRWRVGNACLLAQMLALTGP